MSLSRRTLIAGLLSAAALNQVQAGGAGYKDAKNVAGSGTSSIKFTNNTGMTMEMQIGLTSLISVNAGDSITKTSFTRKGRSQNALETVLAELQYKNILNNMTVTEIFSYPDTPNATDEYFLNYNGTAFSISRTKVDPPAMLSVRRASTAPTTTAKPPVNIRNYRGK